MVIKMDIGNIAVGILIIGISIYIVASLFLELYYRYKREKEMGWE